jgi:hypothetical protein
MLALHHFIMLIVEKLAAEHMICLPFSCIFGTQIMKNGKWVKIGFALINYRMEAKY